MKDSIIILAWPQTPAKSIGMWYDKINEFLGFLKDGYYQAGHAAAVLVNHSKQELYYYDFGRYHMPQKYGRVRSKLSDPALNLSIKPKFSKKGKIININEILRELSLKKECKGKGDLYASLINNVSFKYANKYAEKMQNKDTIPYGPYTIGGTNCSRFIASLIKASKPPLKVRFNLSSSLLFTPLTKANVFACNPEYYIVRNKEVEKKYLFLKDQLHNYMFPFFIKRKKITSFNNELFMKETAKKSFIKAS